MPQDRKVYKYLIPTKELSEATVVETHRILTNGEALDHGNNTLY